MNRRPPIPALTSIRFLAALWVAVFHYGVTLAPRYLPAWSERVRDTAIAAVSLFFVLSGFILVYAYCDEDGHLRCRPSEFLLSRLLRIYPTYLVALGVYVVLFRPATWDRLALKQLLASIFAVQAWIPSYALTWNFVGWSISCEVFFYLCFPVLAPLIGRLPRRSSLLSLAVVSCLLAIGGSTLIAVVDPDGNSEWCSALLASPPPSLQPYLSQFFEAHGTADFPFECWTRHTHRTWQSVGAYNPLFRLTEFLAGMSVGLFFLRARKEDPRWEVPRPIRFLIAVSLVVLVLFASRLFPYSVVSTGGLAPAFAFATLATASLPAGPAARLLGNRLLEVLGESSYELYIFQPVLAFGYFRLAGCYPNMSLAHTLLFLFAATALSVAWHYAIARPSTRWLRGLLAANATLPTGRLSDTA